MSRFKPSKFSACATRPTPRASQRGVSLFFALIAVVVFLISAVAIVRSFNTTLFQAGNLSFKRDLANQSQRAVDVAVDRMRVGAIDTESKRSANVQAENYSASILPSNPQGIPLALLNDTGVLAATNTVFANIGTAANDIELSDANGTNYGTVRYVIERLCNATGDPAALGPSACVYAASSQVQLTSALEMIRADVTTTGGGGGAGAGSQQVVYRITARVTGPRNTQGFFQSTFSR
jgi:type IV pilus assembly protein PilX